MRFIQRWLVVVLMALLPAAAMAQGLPDEKQTIGEIDARVADLARLAEGIEAISRDDQKLLQARLAAEQASRALIDASVQFRPVIGDISARLETFKSATAEGATPSDEVKAAIKALNDRRATINAAMIKAEDGTVAASSLVDKIGMLRRDLFTSTLSQRVELDSVLNGQTAQELTDESRDLWRRLASWLSFSLRFKASGLLWAAGLSLAAALAFLVGVRKWVMPLLAASSAADANPGYLTRVVSAFGSTLLPAGALAVFLSCVYLLLDWFALLRPDISEILAAAMRFIWQVYFVYRLSLAILQPGRPAWRLLPVSGTRARLMHFIAIALSVLTGADALAGAISNTLSSPFSLTVALSFLFAVFIGLLLISVSQIKPFQSEHGTPVAWPTWARLSILLAGILPIVAALFGYVGLARFATQQVVVTGAIAATMFVGILAAQALSRENALRGSAAGHALAARFAWSDRQLDMLGIAASIATYALIALIGFPLILLQWGFQPDDIWSATRSFLTELKVGSVTISLTAILVGILVFFTGYYLSRRFEGWLDQNVLARSRIDRGARTSIRTAVGYLGVALAALVGISVAGVQLSSLALVAGALSVGIGFGLQNIVSNFVSGLILLAERPFKEGDWIEAGGVNGIVKKVSVRATEIETFQRQAVILPNSSLINQAVGNWTHRNTLARVDVPVVVSYGADVVKVQEILRSIAEAHPKAMRTPAPFVLFKSFGVERMEFELRIFIADLFEKAQVETEIRFEVVRRFREAGVDTPFIQPEAVAAAMIHADGEDRHGESPDDGLPPASKPAKGRKP